MRIAPKTHHLPTLQATDESKKRNFRSRDQSQNHEEANDKRVLGGYKESVVILAQVEVNTHLIAQWSCSVQSCHTFNQPQIWKTRSFISLEILLNSDFIRSLKDKSRTSRNFSPFPLTNNKRCSSSISVLNIRI